VNAANMTEKKRANMLQVLRSYAQGNSYRIIQQQMDISRASISELLHLAEKLSKVSFVPDATKKGGIHQMICDVTRTTRAVGLKAASRYDFHALRTTFVTLALRQGISIEKIQAVTGHHLVETVMRHYAKLKGVDAKHELMSAMPKSITEHPGPPSEEEPTAVSKLAEQAKRLSPEDRA
jgi:integrase